MSTYVYTPLSAERPEIRLLKVKASIGQVRTAPLIGSIKVCRFPESEASRTKWLGQSLLLPNYIALSYVWGEPVFSHEIILDSNNNNNGASLRITANLDAALRDLRSTEMADFYVWADGICINQNDIEEKSDQIRLMRQIYQTARLVTIWMGHSTPESVPVLQYIQDLTMTKNDQFLIDAEKSVRRTAERRLPKMGARIGPALQAPVLGFNNVHRGVMKGFGILQDAAKKHGKESQADDAEEVADEETPAAPLEAASIEQIAYWEPSAAALEKANLNKRLNIITKSLEPPEMTALIERTMLEETTWHTRLWCISELALAEHVVILMGNKRLRWLGFAQTIYWLTRSFDAEMLRWTGRTLLDKVKIRYTWAERPSLHGLLRQTGHKKTTDPKDKIYALLSLMADESHPLLEVDHSKTVKEVYTLVTLYLITEGKTFDTICGWNTSDRMDALPSWVPDYSLDHSLAARPLVATEGENSEFDACGGRVPSFAGIAKGNMTGFRKLLSVQGMRVGVVKALVPFDTSALKETQKSEEHETSTVSPTATDFESSVREVQDCVASYNPNQKLSSNPNTTTPSEQTPQSPTSNLAALLSATSITTTTPTTPTSPTAKPSPQNSNNKTLSILQALLNSRLLNPPQKLTKSTLLSTLTNQNTDLDPSARQARISSIIDSIKTQSRGRSVALIENEEVVTVSGDVRVGDWICVVLGCSVPVVLRGVGAGGKRDSAEKVDSGSGEKSSGGVEKGEEREEFILVGECFFDGFMQGEAINKLDNGELKIREFVLR